MRRWKVYTRKYSDSYWWEAHRTWTRAGAERWAVANQDKVFNFIKVAVKR